MLRVLHSLPKPILFGLYGALGGLLGALVFGELIWAMVRPTVAEAAPLKLAASPTVTVYWGGSNRMFVKIARSGFDGPVVVKASSLPADVTIHAIEIPAGQVDGELKVTMEANGEKPASGTEIEVELFAMAVDVPKAIDSASVKLKVELPPTILLLSASPEVRLFEGGSNRFAVKIARQNFEGPVKIDALNLPPGVKIPDVLLAPNVNEMEMTVSADKMSALMRPQPIKLRGTLPHRPELTGIAPIDIMVVAAPPQLTVAVSPQVVLYPGLKNKFTVKIARSRFDGPVVIDALKTPAGIQIVGTMIPAGKSEIEVEAISTSAEESGLPKVQRVPIRAHAQAEKLEATSEIDVRIVPIPPSMNIAVSPIVNVTQGGKGKFMVKLARRGFSQAVRVEFVNAPDGAVFPPAIIPAGMDEVEVEMRARFKTPVGKQPMTANSRAVGVITTDGRADFVLDVGAAKATQPKADVMFVLDVTGTMEFAINGIRDGIEKFVQKLDEEDIDARIGLIAFRDLTADKTDVMTVLKFNGDTFTTDYKAFSNLVGKLTAKGGGDLPESSMEAIQEAARQSYRPGVSKILILITDAPPQGLPGVTGEAPKKGALAPNIAKLANHPLIVLTKGELQKPKIDQLHLVVRNGEDRRIYEMLQTVAKGKFYDLLEIVKGKEGKDKGFADLLSVLSKDIVVTTNAARPDAGASLSAPPMPPSSKGALNLPMVAAPSPPESSLPSPPKVKDVAPPTVADSVAPPSTAMPTLQGVQSSDSYAASDRWQLLIAIALQIAAIAVGISFVLVAGQKLYMSQRFLGLGEAAKSVAGGLLAGLLGGALGQLLYQLSPGNPFMSGITRILAWSIIGAILGGGMGLFVPNMRLLRSAAGGAFGGAIGAVGFILADALAGSFLGRMIGAIVVGFFIGMMVAFAELAFRRYWLEVAFGKHEIRTITLGATPVTIGTDTNAMIRVEAPQPLTLAYRIDHDRVVCQNLDSEKAQDIQPGHQSQIGTVTVTMRSIEQASKLGFALCLSNDEEVSLTEGMPLTAEELPGLESQGADGMVLLVSAHPRDPNKRVLRNRSKQTWKAKKPDGTLQEVAPGASVELALGLRLSFGKITGTLKRDSED